MVIALLKKRGIKYSALKTARFSTRDEDGKKTLGPIVIWIATHPNTTRAENARDASPDILHILEDHKVDGAVVEWYEGSVEKLSGPALMRVADETNPTHYVRRPFTTALGMPIATNGREEADAQGTVSFFFHENKCKNGEPSARVLAVSNKHVLRAGTTVDYRFKGTGAPRQYVRVCGFHRFQRFLDETRALVAKNVAEAVRLAEEIVRLEAEPKSENQEQGEEDEDALEIEKDRLKKVNKDNGKLQAFFKEASTQWIDIARRTIGFVDWAPSISIDADDRHYTRDIGTVELDSQKFKDNFQGNVVDLGAFCLISLMNIFRLIKITLREQIYFPRAQHYVLAQQFQSVWDQVPLQSPTQDPGCCYARAPSYSRLLRREWRSRLHRREGRQHHQLYGGTLFRTGGLSLRCAWQRVHRSGHLQLQ